MNIIHNLTLIIIQKVEVIINNLNDTINFIVRFLSELQVRSNEMKCTCGKYLKKITELQEAHEAERYELRNEFKQHDIRIIKKQII
jgi:hypothetical protein